MEDENFGLRSSYGRCTSDCSSRLERPIAASNQTSDFRSLTSDHRPLAFPMKPGETFVLTLFYDPQGKEEPTVRLRHIATNRVFTSIKLSELGGALAAFLQRESPENPEIRFSLRNSRFTVPDFRHVDER